VPESLAEEVEVESTIQQTCGIFLSESRHIFRLYEDPEIFMTKVPSGELSVKASLATTHGDGSHQEVQ